MISFEWNAAYSVGDDRIDDQHKTLMRLMNEYYLSQLSSQPGQAQACLSQLLAQTVRHFREEETMMERTGYPRFQEHRRQHQEVLGMVSKLVKDYQQSQSREDAGKLTNFFKAWLVRHILGEDKDYAPYVHKAPAVRATKVSSAALAPAVRTDV